jgi:hypothetical protein
MTKSEKIAAYGDKIKKALESMRCGEIRKSYKPDKKVMQKVCEDGKAKIIHAGDSRYKNNYDPAKKANFRARHHCDEAKPGTSQHLACQALWPKGKHNQWDTKN